MTRRIDENASPTAGYSEVAQANARQVEAFLEAQTAMTVRLHEANASMLKRGETLTAMAGELTGKLIAARTVADATAAWQEWLVLQLRLASVDAKRYLEDLQLLLSESSNAITTGWARASGEVRPAE